ncbi:hypothetical protein KP509_03G012800 [Ceratopteris richardii]|uniref:Uncharacterized protein n=1 Tax=Ceratopteris richardii TaxID=49495 RepID=A0A8T2V1J3_CERRI|nr:hypothetical protein KP509_03G012800 [Ceratopteris richardii]
MISQRSWLCLPLVSNSCRWLSSWRWRSPFLAVLLVSSIPRPVTRINTQQHSGSFLPSVAIHPPCRVSRHSPRQDTSSSVVIDPQVICRDTPSRDRAPRFVDPVIQLDAKAFLPWCVAIHLPSIPGLDLGTL